MIPTLFVTVAAPGTIAPRDLAAVEAHVAAIPGLTRGTVLTPAPPAGDQPFAADGPGPALVLQLDFARAADRDAALSAKGGLARLVAAGVLPSLAGAPISVQPMTGRDFPVPDPRGSENACTFLVTYPGRTDDLPAWLDHYDANHPPIMVRFPGIREVMTFRPVEGWETGLPVQRGAAMQRNKVVFDSGDALVAALASPVMAEMRADGATFPPYAPRATHYPMDTRVVRPR